MSDRVFAIGDRVLLLDVKRRRYLVELREGGEFHSHAGFVPHAEIIGRSEGVTVESTKAAEYTVLRPTLEDFVLEMPRGAQVIYPKDLAPILMLADIGPGMRVFESGLGSGALSTAMLRAGAEIVGYEVREDFANRARTNVRSFLGEAALDRYHVNIADSYADIDAELDVDAEVDTDTGMGFQFFTLKNLIAFFTIFSWTGLASIQAGNSNGVTIIISIVAGLIMMTIMASIFYFMGKLAHSGTLNMNNAIGQIGTVYLPIPAKRGQMGQIQINIQGGMRTLQALTDDDADLSVGTVVEVKSVVSENVLIVTKSGG